jgi:hypothetical protein
MKTMHHMFISLVDMAYTAPNIAIECKNFWEGIY